VANCHLLTGLKAIHVKLDYYQQCVILYK